MSHGNDAIICVMSVLRTTDRGGNPVKLVEQEYTFNGESGVYRGAQTNEAPIRFLLEEAHARHRDIDQIICLVSRDCQSKHIPVSHVDQLLSPDSSLRSVDYCSTEDFLYERICRFCEEAGISIPAINPIPYDPERPSDSLASIAEYLGSGFRVSIDMTGGPRDAATLMTLAAEIVKFNSEDNVTGPIVYSNQTSGEIVEQRDTFGLIDLFSAIDAFTEHGRASDICGFFGVDDANAGWCTDETRAACVAMRNFADDLSLCRVWNVGARVMEVQDALNRASESLVQKRSRFNGASEALQSLENPTGSGYSSYQEVVDELRIGDIADFLDFETPSSLVASLEELRDSNAIARSELLFSYLIGTIQDRFIPNSENSAVRTLGAIRWCTERYMVLQALAILREGIVDCLVESKRLNVDNYAYDAYKNELSAHEHPVKIQDICNACMLSERNGSVDKVKIKRGSDYARFASIPNPSDSALIEVVAWYKVLRSHRNRAVHVSVGKMHSLEKKSIHKVLGPNVDIDGDPSVAELQIYLTRVVECIESMLYSSKTTCEKTGEDKATTPIIALIEEYASERGMTDIPWNDFRKWCETERDFPITKQSLGVSKNLTIPRWLEGRHPGKVSRSGTADRPMIHLLK